MSDPMLPQGTNYCKCPTCDAYFTGEYPFRLHRVGVLADRRCLSVSEMADKGMSLNAKGYWISRKRAAA